MTKTERRKLDPRDAAAYSMAEAARYVRLPPATLRSWAVGRRYATRGGPKDFHPLIKIVDPKGPWLSFWDLIEAHVLRALRTEHGVQIRDVRKAIGYAESQLGLDHLLLRRELVTGGGELLLERYGQLISLSRSGQLAMKEVLEKHLKRVEWDRDHFPIRLFPIVTNDLADEARRIAIDPSVAFGRPIIRSRGVTTGAIAARIDAGENLDDVARDYGLDQAEALEAVVFERAA